MAKEYARIEVYVPTKAEKIKISQIAEKTGQSVGSMMLKAFDYWVQNNPKAIEDLAEEYHDLRTEREAKETERDTGDLLGSFEKMEDKIEKANKAFKEGRISKETRNGIIALAEKDYKTTAEIKIKRVKKKAEKIKTEIERKEPKKRKLITTKELKEKVMEKSWKKWKNQLYEIMTKANKYCREHCPNDAIFWRCMYDCGHVKHAKLKVPKEAKEICDKIARLES